MLTSVIFFSSYDHLSSYLTNLSILNDKGTFQTLLCPIKIFNSLCFVDN